MFQEIMVTKIAETDTAIRHNQDTTTVETEITRHQHLNQAEVTIMAASVHPIPEIWAAADLDPAVAQEEWVLVEDPVEVSEDKNINI